MTIEPAGSEAPLEDLRQVTEPELAYLSVEDLLSELLERIRRGLSVDTAAILLLDDDRRVLMARAAKGIEEEVRAGVRVPLGRGFAGRVASERRPIALEDIEAAELVNPLLRQRGIKSLLGVPLLVEGRPIGVLHVGTLKRRRFDENAIRMLQLAADRAALAIESARLSEQRALTEVLQRTLLPNPLPQIPGLRLSAKYLPATSGLKLGGDWYDVFTFPDGRVALVIGDAVGHGVSAAAVMVEVRTALRAFAMERHRPLTIVGLLNDLMVSLGRGRSATLGLLTLAFEDAELEAVSAGHLPALLRHADGSREFVGEATGPPLGAFASAVYDAATFPFPAGSSLLLYTDGLVERRGASIEAGMQRLSAALRPGAPADVPLADAVFERLPDERLEDDVACLAVESLMLSDTFDFELEAVPAVLSPLRRAISRWLAELGATATERFDLTLACSEAAANAIEHAHGPSHANFEVTCRYRGSEAKVTIRDRGSWRELSGRERGRGMMLMQELTDDLIVESDTGGTRVVLTKTLTRARHP